MTRTVLLHVFAHTFIEQLSVLRQIHVYEIDDDDTAHIPKPELSGQFVGSAEIDLQCILLLPVFRLCAVAAVYVHHVHGLCVFNDEISAALIVDRLAEC